MYAQWLKRRWLKIGALLVSGFLLAACQADSVVTARSATLEVQNSYISAAVAPESLESDSGVQLTAHMSSPCTSAVCPQPYAGEFVITELNGAEVTRVFTNHDGQATVHLPPGQYLLGVRTEEIYPLAAPATVNILANRYVSVDMSLIAGSQQSQSQ